MIHMFLGTLPPQWPKAVNSVSEYLRSGVELNYIASYLVPILPKEKINLMAVS